MLNTIKSKFLLGVLGFNSVALRRNLSFLLFVCRVLVGDADRPKLVEQLVKLYVPDVPRIILRPRKRPLLAVPAALTAARQQSALPCALALLNSLLMLSPERSLLAHHVFICCERIDDMSTTVPTWYFHAGIFI